MRSVVFTLGTHHISKHEHRVLLWESTHIPFQVHTARIISDPATLYGSSGLLWSCKLDFYSNMQHIHDCE